MPAAARPTVKGILGRRLRHQEVKEFSASGLPLGSVDVSNQGSPCPIGFDEGNDDLYVSTFGGPVYVYRHTATGYASGVLFSSQSARAIAVDPVTTSSSWPREAWSTSTRPTDR